MDRQGHQPPVAPGLCGGKLFARHKRAPSSLKFFADAVQPWCRRRLLFAHTADGRVLPRAIHNVETGQAETVSTWGEYVPDEVWERIKADKKSDGILDETLFAVKKRGELTPQIVMNGVAKVGVRRQITRW